MWDTWEPENTGIPAFTTEYRNMETRTQANDIPHSGLLGLGDPRFRWSLSCDFMGFNNISCQLSSF